MFEKIKLDYISLEPYIDDRTLDIHYNKHYQKYLDNLNRLLREGNYKFSSIYDLIENIDSINLNDRGEILFNLGGVINHSLYFYDMSDRGNINPIGRIKDDIDIYFNTYDEFKSEFKKSAMNLQGSGYTFLVLDDNKNFIIPFPEENRMMKEKFDDLILKINAFDVSQYKQTNIEKCKHCIYEPSCDRSLL